MAKNNTAIKEANLEESYTAEQIDEIETPLKLEIQRKTTPLQEQIRRFQEAAWGLDFHHKDGLFFIERCPKEHHEDYKCSVCGYYDSRY